MNIQSQDRRERHGRTAAATAFRRQPTVVVCIDGSEPGYIEARDRERAGAEPRPPHAHAARTSSRTRSIPSFTNPNNLSIITGRPPAVHGICGNYFYDPTSGQGGDDERPEASCAPTPS